jgi:hypothetical protein
MSGGRSSLLPAGFEALEPFAPTWAIAGAANRAERRMTSSEAERIAFFDAAKDLLAPALARLDEKPLDQFDEKEARLMNLMLAFAHVDFAVEIQGGDESKHVRGARRMRITRAPADQEP